ncbi:hypothetical protein [Pontibacter diazotrophicus]|nr:hypothetical protein [Pontibacter diazotrophicus]
MNRPLKTWNPEKNKHVHAFSSSHALNQLTLVASRTSLPRL